MNVISKILISFSMLFCVRAHANDFYSGGDIDQYDPVSGLYYKAIKNKADEGGYIYSKVSSNSVININLFDPTNEETKLLFATPIKGTITEILFETELKNGAVVFNQEYARNIKDNQNVPSRAPKDKLLVAVRDDESHQTSLYVADRHGGGLKSVATVPEKSNWHIDVKNSKLRVVNQIGQGVVIQSVDW